MATTSGPAPAWTGNTRRRRESRPPCEIVVKITGMDQLQYLNARADPFVSLTLCINLVEKMNREPMCSRYLQFQRP
jgi:hypothetical protein